MNQRVDLTRDSQPHPATLRSPPNSTPKLSAQSTRDLSDLQEHALKTPEKLRKTSEKRSITIMGKKCLAVTNLEYSHDIVHPVEKYYKNTLPMGFPMRRVGVSRE